MMATCNGCETVYDNTREQPVCPQCGHDVILLQFNGAMLEPMKLAPRLSPVEEALLMGGFTKGSDGTWSGTDTQERKVEHSTGAPFGGHRAHTIIDSNATFLTDRP